MMLHYTRPTGHFFTRLGGRFQQLYRPKFGFTKELSPKVHAIFTASLFDAAERLEQPDIPVVVTRFPKVRLLVAIIKERI